MSRIAVLGGGAWGTALASVAVSAGHEVALWARSTATVDDINNNHANAAYLPGVALPQALRATPDAAVALHGADIVLAVTPAQTTRAVLGEIAPLVGSATLVLCAKGIERSTGAFLTDIAAETLPATSCAVLSGPGFAGEVARGLPTAVTVAADAGARALALAEALSTSRFRCYASSDPRGVEAGGALKNVLAIAAGAAHGAGLGASAGAALITRGFAELKRLGVVLGGSPATFDGLSGLGDLLLTCSSEQSRNFAFGMALATGQRAEKLAEGAATAYIARDLAARHAIATPIIAAVADLIDGRLTIADAVAALMARPIRSEQD